MNAATMEERLAQLERKVREIEERLPGDQSDTFPSRKRGWRWFVGVFADSPDFDEVERIGREWREAELLRDEDINQ
jgi:hypothetical protein